MNFLKKNVKVIIGVVVSAIITMGISVYATYSYFATDISYTKPGTQTEISVEQALNDLYAIKTQSFTGEFCLSAKEKDENDYAEESYCDINTRNYNNMEISITSILGSSMSSYYECKIYGDNSEILTINSYTTYELDVSQYSKIRIYYKENNGWFRVKGVYTLSN